MCDLGEGKADDKHGQYTEDKDKCNILALTDLGKINPCCLHKKTDLKDRSCVEIIVYLVSGFG